MEIDPKYVDVICQRWMALTNKQVTLDGSGGQTFEQVKRGRGMEAEDAIKEEVIETLPEASN